MKCKKRIARAGLLMALLLSLVLGLSACGNGADGTFSDMDQDAVLKAIEEAEPDLPAMQAVTDQDEDPDTLLSAVSDIDPGKVDHFLIYYSTDGKAEEIVILDCKNESAAKDAADSFEDHVDARAKLFEQYAPAEASTVDKARWEQKGHYAILVISKHPDAVLAAIEEALTEWR